MPLLQHAPRLSADDAAHLARELYGLNGTAAPLTSERDQNFLLESVAGRFVLKIANALEHRDFLEAQNAAMAHVAALGLCPRVVPSIHGRDIEPLPGGHAVRLLTWMRGQPLAAVGASHDRLLEDLGRHLGRLSASLATFDHPAAHREFHWDIARGFEVVAEYAPLIEDPWLRGLVERISAHVHARDGAALRRLRRSVVHGDANDYNVIVDGDPPHVSGVIDFGDMVYSYTVADPAIAIAYALLDREDPLETAAAILRGYHTVHPLTEDELSVVFGLVKLRLCVSAAMAAYQQRQRPSDEYLAISQRPIRRTLPRLAEIHPDAAEERLRQALGGAERAPQPCTKADTLARRRGATGASLSLAYRDPVKVTRGWMQYLFDETGRRYLDAYNNVPHVGHAHPRVVEAATRQMRAVNTNTRYLHDNLWRLAERLTASLPEPLSVCYFVNSGSEANELALRLARTHTGAHDLIVLEAAYHGNTTTLIDISPYKFDGPGGRGAPGWVHVAPIPDDYRGPHRRDDPDAGPKYGAAVGEIIDSLRRRDLPLCGFIAETCPSVGGQIMPPPGYLDAVFRLVRGAGGVCIADEVQTGLGRLGAHFYGFQAQGVTPDIVVLGKPIGNGYPIGAVVTTKEIAASFDNGMEFFSTFGGSTVSCAVALEVLAVIQDERLQAHAQRVGDYLLRGLRELSDRHEVIGDVRGSGLFIGVELVRDRTTKEPATEQAARVVDGMREAGILLGTEGPFHNVLKIRPPMPFDERDTGLLLDALGAQLA